MSMDKELTAETIEELIAAYMDLPWLDEVRLHKGHVHSVTIIPSDDVSTEEKLMMTFAGDSTMPHRVPVLMQEIAAALGCAQPITAIVHGGGARYTFLHADSCAVSIPTDDMSVETYLRVLFLLKEISLTAQALFVVRPAHVEPRLLYAVVQRSNQSSG
jgi:hypothetical protein